MGVSFKKIANPALVIKEQSLYFYQAIIKTAFYLKGKRLDLCSMAKGIKGNREAIKAKALDLFLNTDKTQKEISDLLGVAEKTLSLWKKNENWEELKGAAIITSAKIIRNLYNKAHSLSEAGNIDADKLIKIASAIEKLSDRKTTVSQFINCFKEFNVFIHSRNPDLAKTVNKLQQEFILKMVNS